MLDVVHLSKNFGSSEAVAPVDFTQSAERVLGIIGPSGCGKSTLLRLLAGLERPTSGTMRLDGQPIAGPRADIGVVFQEPRLLPWLDVRANVAFGLWDRGTARKERAIDAALTQVGLAAHARKRPKELSGGMAQRVGIARALVLRPRLLLLDEPFSALDPITRMRMQDHLLDLVGTDVPNVILVTHDIEEALVLSDRILVLQGPPARVVRDLGIDLPRPRKRSDGALQELREILTEIIVPDPAV